jgi:hypothetical protein
MPTIRAALLLAAAGACATGAPAQTIWRCGDSYGAQPCADGRPLADAPAATREDRAQAQAATARDARLADSLEKERLRLEAQAPQAVIPAPRSEPAPEKHKWPEQAATRKLDVFTASAPGSKPAKGQAKSKAKPQSGGDKDAKGKDTKKPAAGQPLGAAARTPGPAAGAPARP